MRWHWPSDVADWVLLIVGVLVIASFFIPSETLDKRKRIPVPPPRETEVIVVLPCGAMSKVRVEAPEP